MVIWSGSLHMLSEIIGLTSGVRIMSQSEQKRTDLKLVQASPEFLQEDCPVCRGSSRLPDRYELVRPDESGVLLNLDKSRYTMNARLVFHGRRKNTSVLYLQASFRAVANACVPSEGGASHLGIFSIIDVAPDSWDYQARVYFKKGEILLGSLEEYRTVSQLGRIPRQLKLGGFVVFGHGNGRPDKIIKLPLMHLALRRF